jgi:hypothetical protein
MVTVFLGYIVHPKADFIVIAMTIAIFWTIKHWWSWMTHQQMQ